MLITRLYLNKIKKTTKINFIMPRACCRLHRLLDSDNLTQKLDKDKFTNFCEFIQNSCHKRSKTLLTYENPNDKEVYIYLFGGSGTRYLTTVLGEYIAFTPQKALLGDIKWYPVIGTRLTSQTKYLTILGNTKLPTALLLILSYYENHLKQHIHYNLISHMTIPNQIQCLLFILQITNDDNLQKLIAKRITSITLCDEDSVINTFTTYDRNNSFANTEKLVSNHFDSHLTLHCTEEKQKPPEYEKQEKWKKNITTFLMMENWSKLNPTSMTTKFSNKSSQKYGETTTSITAKQTELNRNPIMMMNQPETSCSGELDNFQFGTTNSNPIQPTQFSRNHTISKPVDVDSTLNMKQTNCGKKRKTRTETYIKTCCLSNNVITRLMNINFEEFLTQKKN